MKLLFIFFFVALRHFVPVELVMYGRFISIKDAPYFVSLLVPGMSFYVHACGGSIISEYWVITAAHCVSGHYKVIRAGKSIFNKQKSSSIYEIEKIFVHGNYNKPTESTAMNDIALIKLKVPIRFDEYKQGIRIRKTPPRENETVVTLGFGDQGDAKGNPIVLRKTEVTVINETICDFETETCGIENVVFCAGNGTSDACRGDSGGPAVIDGQLAGLVSYGPDCHNYKNHDHNSGKYTRVDAFYDWILEITGIVY